MPQIFQVLRCYKCLVFQVHQCKKSNKWQCKLCGEKQSVKRHHGVGTGKDCRMHVQKLNMLRSDKEEAYINLSDSDECDEQVELTDEEGVSTNTKNPNLEKNSKWATYVDKSDELLEVNKESMYLGKKEDVLENSFKRKHSTTQMQKYFKDNENSFKRIASSGYLKKVTIEKTLNDYDQNDIAVMDKNCPITSMTKKSKWETYLDKSEQQLKLEQNKDFDKGVVLESQQKQLCVRAKNNLHVFTSSTNYLVDAESSQLDNLSSNSKKNESKIFVNNKMNKQLFASGNVKEINTNSKWCKYIGGDDVQETFKTKITQTVKNTHQGMYSLCDDNDLDIILNV